LTPATRNLNVMLHPFVTYNAMKAEMCVHKIEQNQCLFNSTIKTYYSAKNCINQIHNPRSLIPLSRTWLNNSLKYVSLLH